MVRRERFETPANHELVGTFPSWRAMLSYQHSDITTCAPESLLGIQSRFRIKTMYSRSDKKVVKLLTCEMKSPKYTDSSNKQHAKCRWKGAALCETSKSHPTFKIGVDYNILCDVPHQLFTVSQSGDFEVCSESPRYVSALGHLHLLKHQLQSYGDLLGIPRALTSLFSSAKCSTIQLVNHTLTITIDCRGSELENADREDIESYHTLQQYSQSQPIKDE